MDFFDGPLFRINKILLFSVGLWPYQSTFEKLLTMPIGIFGVTCLCIPQMIYIYENIDQVELDYLFSCLPTFFGSLIGITKCASIVLKIDQMKELLGLLREDWGKLIVDEEVKILKSYAMIGRYLTFGYAIFAAGPIMGFISLPAFIPLLDIIIPLNESRSRELPYPAEYFVNQEEHYYAVLINECLSSFIALTLVAAADTTYVIFIQHVCGMFSILRFSELIESTFTSCFIFDVVLGLLLLSATCVMIVICMDRLSEAIKYLPIVAGQGLRLFFNSWIGQKLMDHSTDVLIAAYGGNWYFSSHRTRKLILQLMIRCRTPCKISIAKLYVMSLDGFSKVVRASLSYCTVMTSLRDGENAA